MSSFPIAQQFIFDSLRMGGAPSQVAAMGEEGWAEFAALVRMHRLGPLMHYKLARGSLAMPQEVRERLRASYIRNSMRNLDLYRELVAVAKIFDAAGIPFIALKGAYLARFAYPEIGMRPLRDLDLLVPRDRAITAFHLLVEHGYRSSRGGMLETLLHEKKHLPVLISPQGGVLEIHVRLTEKSRKDLYVTPETVWQRSRGEMVGNHEIRFPCPEDLLLHLCVHASQEHMLNVGPLVLADIAYLVESRGIDWEDFLDATRKGGWQRCVLPLLFLSRRYAGADIPDRVIESLGGMEPALAENSVSLMFADPEMHTVLHASIHELLDAGSLHGKAARLFRRVFPPRGVVAEHFPVSAGSAKTLLFYPAYWMRLLRLRLPPLWAAYFGRQSEFKTLAQQRSAFLDWLNGRGDCERK